MSADRLSPPIEQTIAEIVEQAKRTAIQQERHRCADIAAFYPLEHFAYDCSNTGELLRLRDTISEAILKDVPKGEMIR